MLPQTQIAGHLVIERATLPPPPYGGKIKSKTLCQATVLATQIWLKLDSENLNRSLLCTFGRSEWNRPDHMALETSGCPEEDKRGDRCGFTLLHPLPTKLPLLVVRILRL